MDKRIGKKLLKIASTISLIAFLVMVTAFLYYPNKSKLKVILAENSSERITRNVSINLLTKISPISNTLGVSDSNTAGTYAIERISPEELAKYQNEGEVFTKVEDFNTKLSIESADISGAVFDGEDAFTMEKGLWHFPLSVGPGDKGNFIVIGHRFAKLPPETDTFFNLDKVKVGDKIVVQQDGGIEYTYTVVNTREVDKYDRSVITESDGHTITLITCAPLWESSHRLVVTGVLDKIYRNI